MLKRILICCVAMTTEVAFAQSVTNPVPLGSRNEKAHEHNATAKSSSPMKYQASSGFNPLTFEMLSGFQIKVDWVMNATNSAFDTLKKEGDIPEQIRSLHGKRISISGFMKPLKQDGGGATEFLLMRYFSTCCEGKAPQINEWIHVRTTGKAIPLANDQMLAVRGILQVGEKLGAGNVVSIYRLEEAELETMDSSQSQRPPTQPRL